MLRLLGILSLGHLLFGRRHHALRRGILFGAIIGLFARNDFDSGRVAEDVREKAKIVRKTARDARRSLRHAVRDAKREIREARKSGWVDHPETVRAEKEVRKAERDQRIAEHLDAVRAEREARKAERDQRIAEHLDAVRAKKETLRAERARRKAVALTEAEPNEAQENRELLRDLERNARTAAMMADVPTIEFPEDDPKYHSARKYGYA